MIKEKITALVKKDEKSNKKKIENLVFALILLIITILIVNNVFSKDKDKKEISKEEQIENTIATKEKERDLEKDLEEILKKIKGIEDVQVLITYSQTEQFVPVYNESSSQSTTSEKDTEGGERTIESIDTNKEVISDSNQNPITEKVIYPKAEGAIISVKGNIQTRNKRKYCSSCICNYRFSCT